MIVTVTIEGVMIEASGTPEECEAFVRAMIAEQKKPHWREAQPAKACNPFAVHFGTCGAPDCPIGPNGRVKRKPDTSANPICAKCNDTGAQHSMDNINWVAGFSPVARFMRECNGVH